jgi:PadR family transcriptional regulator, regulatory protein PadR
MSEKLTFEDILNELMLEEPEPTHAALLRWQGRYPQYRNELAEFFATWAIQRDSPEPEPEIDEEWIVQQGVSHAMEILGRQGRLISPDSIGPLDELEQLVLTAVYLLHGRGYIVSITDKVSEMAGKEVLLGSAFAALSRLENHGLVLSRHSDPETEPEGKTRRYFAITLTGERALALARETSKRLTDLLGDFA